MRIGDPSDAQGLPIANAAGITKNTDNIMFNAFYIAVNGSLSVHGMVDGVVDAFEDETGIDAGSSVNESYNTDYYENASGTDLATGGTASGSTEALAASNAFDNDEGTRWQTSTAPTGWLEYDLGSGNAATVRKYRYLNKYPAQPLHRPKDIAFKASNTGAFAGEEVTLDSLTNSPTADSVWIERSFANSTAYRYYRWYITTYDAGQEPLCNEAELYSVENMTLQSVAFTAGSQPDTCRINIYEEDVDSVTVNTDIKAWVSRDGGTTFTQITLLEQGNYDTGQRILSGEVDISGQPSGTSLKYKITTLNLKSLRVHGASLTWV